MIKIRYADDDSPEWVKLLPKYLPAVPRVGEYIGFGNSDYESVVVKKVVYYEDYVEIYLFS